MRRLLLALPLLAACGGTVPRTEVLAVVDAETMVAAGAVKLHVTVSGGPAGGALTADAVQDVGSAAAPVTFPVRIAIVPENSDATRIFLVEAVALDALDQPVGVVRARSGFLARRTLVLPLLLEDCCRAAAPSCAGTQTCAACTCVATPDVAASSLGDYDADAAVDAGHGADAGLDAGPDAGPEDGGVCAPSTCAWGACTSTGVCDDPVQLAVGKFHVCARRASGTVYCWGSNTYGQLGDGSTSERHVPTQVSGVADAVDLTAGDYYTCVVRTGGRVACWGNNDNGQLGDGTTSERHAPTAISGPLSADRIVAGGFHTCALRAGGGEVFCWGANAFGQLGTGFTTDANAPTAVVGLSTADELALGYDHSCARTGATMVCWGDNTDGQLGDGTTTSRPSVTAVAGLADAVGIAAGGNHTCAARSGGTLACWGINSHGELGDGTTSGRTAPTPVVITPLDHATAGDSQTCALQGGAAFCWGNGTNGQLGDDTTTMRLAPVAVGTLADAVELRTGYATTCARRANGAVLCWGLNSNGQVGDGTTTERHAPTAVVPP